MSLRMFHLFFIALSVALAAFFAAWAVGEYRAANEAAYIAVAGLSAMTGAALIWYGRAFQRKTRQL